MRRSNRYPLLPTDRKKAHEWEPTDSIQVGTSGVSTFVDSVPVFVFSRKVQDIRVWKCQKCGHTKSVNRKPSKYEKVWVTPRSDRLFCDDYTVIKVMET